MTTAIEILELDVEDPRTLDLLLPSFQADTANDFVGHAVPDAGFLGVMIGPRANRTSALLAAVDADGTVAAAAFIGHHDSVNRTLCAGGIWSDPARRRQGFTTALLPALQDWARAQGCDRLTLNHPVTEGGDAFAAKHGGRTVYVEKRSALDLRQIDRKQYAEWATPSAANAGYRTVRWSAYAPDGLVESYVRARNAMLDAPHGDLELEQIGLTVQRQRDGEASAAALGMTAHVLVAVTDDDEVAGYTQVFTFPGTDFGQASIGDTAVVAAHRGHGLGLRLKAEQTLWALDNLPHIDVFDTWNHEDNAPMLRINTLMGYRLAEVWHMHEFTL